MLPGSKPLSSLGRTPRAHGATRLIARPSPWRPPDSCLQECACSRHFVPKGSQHFVACHSAESFAGSCVCGACRRVLSLAGRITFPACVSPGLERSLRLLPLWPTCFAAVTTVHECSWGRVFVSLGQIRRPESPCHTRVRFAVWGTAEPTPTADVAASSMRGCQTAAPP